MLGSIPNSAYHRSTMDWEAFFLTIRLAICTACALVIIGLPLAYWLARTHWKGRIFIEAIVALPLVLPPTVLGFYLLLLFGPQTGIGHWLQFQLGWRLPFTFTGLLVGSVLYSLPFAVQPFVAAFRFVEREMIEAALADGASEWVAFRTITLPLAWPGVLVGFVLSFSHTIGEFGVVMMIGGNIAGRTRTLSMSIYDQVQSLNYRQASVTSAVLLVFSFAVLTWTYAYRGNSSLQLLTRRAPNRQKPVI